MNLRRSLPSILTTATLVVCAALSLGVPNFGLAGEYLSGGFPSEEAALAVASIFCWLLIIGMAIGTIILSVRTATEAQIIHRRWTRATTYVASGVIVLAMGTVRHLSSDYSMCCGTTAAHIAEAQQLVQSH